MSTNSDIGIFLMLKVGGTFHIKKFDTAVVNLACLLKEISKLYHAFSFWTK